MKKATLLTLVVIAGNVLNATNPLSKVSIKSGKAYTTPLKGQPGVYLVRYEKDVHVDLADKTEMTAEQLDVIVARTSSSTKKSGALGKADLQAEQVRSVVLKGNVKINRLNQAVRGDKAELLVNKKQCSVQGNVHIVQKKSKENDVPVVIDSNKALLDLQTERFLLVGTDQAPVSTVFEFKSFPLKNEKTKRA